MADGLGMATPLGTGARSARVTRFAEQLVDYVAGALAAPRRASLVGRVGRGLVGPGPVTNTGVPS